MVSSSVVISTFPTPSSNNTFMSRIQTRSRSASDPGRLQTEVEDELESSLRQAVVGSQLPSPFLRQSLAFDPSGVMSQPKMNPKLEINPASAKAYGKTASQSQPAHNVNTAVKTKTENNMTASTKATPNPKSNVETNNRFDAHKDAVNKPTTNPNRPKTALMTKPKRSLEGDLSAISEEQLKALAHPSSAHIKIAFLNICNGVEASPAPEIVFESYPLPLLEFVSPKVRGILAARREKLRAVGKGFKHDISFKGKQESTKFVDGKDTSIVNGRDKGDKTNANCTNARRVSYAEIAASTSSTLELEAGNPAVVEAGAGAVKATSTPTIKAPTGIILPTSAPRALQILLEYALISCSPTPVSDVAASDTNTNNTSTEQSTTTSTSASISATTTTTTPISTSTSNTPSTPTSKPDTRRTAIGPHTLPAHLHIQIPLPQHAFYKYARIAEEARFLEFTWLENLFVKRIRRIAAGQVHTNCLERVLGNTDALVLSTAGGAAGAGGNASAGTAGVSGVSVGSIKELGADEPSGAGRAIGARPAIPPGKGRGAWFRRIAVESIAKAIFDGRLQYAFKYERLRDEYPAFDAELVWKIGELERQAAGRRGVGNGRRGSEKGD